MPGHARPRAEEGVPGTRKKTSSLWFLSASGENLATDQKCLRQAPAAPEVEQWRLTHREIIELRAGRSGPHRKMQELLVSIVQKLGLREERN